MAAAAEGAKMKCQTHRAGSTNPQKLEMREEQRALQADWRWKNLSAAAAKGPPVVLVHHSTSTGTASTVLVLVVLEQVLLVPLLQAVRYRSRLGRGPSTS